MNLKTPFTYFLVILLASQLASCATASPTPEIITPTPLSTLTPTATPIPSETPTPQPTGTPTASPTPEFTLNGLEPDLSKFPILSHEQEWLLLQKAIDQRSLTPKMTKSGFMNSNLYHTNEVDFKDKIIGDGVTLDCDISLGGCEIVASYQINGIRKILLEYAATFEDGSQGSVILPVVIEMDTFDPTALPDQRTIQRISELAKVANYRLAMNSIVIVTSLDDDAITKKMANAELRSLIDSALADGSRSAELLNKMHELAKQNKSLSQDEINELIDALIWF